MENAEQIAGSQRAGYEELERSSATTAGEAAA
jgi:hypothetical protein